MDSLSHYLTTNIPDYIFITAFLLMALAVVGCIAMRSSMRWLPRIINMGYIFLVLCSTVFFRNTYSPDVKIMLVPFWNYAEVFSFKDLLDSWEVILNVMMFIPIGLLTSVSFKRVRWFHILFVGVILSTSIETLQYILQRGLCETNDVIHNALGALLGYVICRS